MWPERTAAAGSMSAGPRLQLAVLWPWLLLATLQVRLGYSGLALAAAMAAERSGVQKAIIRVIPFKLEPLTLEGAFASVAEVMPAEGKLLQVRGLGFAPPWVHPAKRVIPTPPPHEIGLCTVMGPGAF